MNKHASKFLFALFFISAFVISGVAQESVPVEKEPMHRLKLENEFVRVFDVLVPIGKSTQFHVHVYDGISIRMSNTQIVDETPGGEKAPFEITFGAATFSSRTSPQTHRVINSGKSDFRNILIELLTPKNAVRPIAFPVLSDGHVILIDNDRVRINRLILKPGESSKMHTHQMHGLGLVLFDSKIEISLPDGTKRNLEAKAGDAVWQNKGTAHVIKNTGTTVFEAIDIELK